MVRINVDSRKLKENARKLKTLRAGLTVGPGIAMASAGTFFNYDCLMLDVAPVTVALGSVAASIGAGVTVVRSSELTQRKRGLRDAAPKQRGSASGRICSVQVRSPAANWVCSTVPAPRRAPRRVRFPRDPPPGAPGAAPGAWGAAPGTSGAPSRTPQAHPSGPAPSPSRPTYPGSGPARRQTR